MNDIQIFNNEDFGEVRSVMIDGEPWFVGKDVTDILGYQNASKALADHVDDDDKLNNESLSSLGQRGGWLINEAGVYSLIFSSKLESAKAFKRWVTHTVLPEIRKTGGYGIDRETEYMRVAAEYKKYEAEELKERNANANVFLSLGDSAFNKHDRQFFYDLATNAAAGRAITAPHRLKPPQRNFYTPGMLADLFECSRDHIMFLIEKLNLDDERNSHRYFSEDGSQCTIVYNQNACDTLEQYFNAFKRDKMERLLFDMKRHNAIEFKK